MAAALHRARGARHAEAPLCVKHAREQRCDAAVCAQLLKDLIADPAVKNRLMIDVMNEPGGPRDLSFISGTESCIAVAVMPEPSMGMCEVVCNTDTWCAGFAEFLLRCGGTRAK